MIDSSAAAMKGGQSPHAPLIERRQCKSSPHHIMCLDVRQPNSLLLKLETVSAGKELAQKEDKSRMDPELEELKGFMDLGFEFRKDQLTPRLLFLLPGLKRLIDHENNTKILEFQESTLQNSQLPNPNAEGVDMKEYLKLWARSVPSTLKIVGFEEAPFQNWELPNPKAGVDMKEYLKLWARSVALTLKC